MSAGTTAPAPVTPAPVRSGPRTYGIVAVFAVAVVLLIVLSAVHLTQGTAGIGLGELLRALWPGGEHDDARTQAVAVLVDSRMPRLSAALLVGLGVGIAGAVLQSVARNPLASPDTLAVNAGAYVSVVAVAAFGISLPFLAGGTVAFAGGLLASGLVLLVSRGGAAGPTRLVLAGSAVALALNSLTTVLLMLFQQNTIGLFAWGSGTTVQSGSQNVTMAAPVLAVGVVIAGLLANRLDVLGLGDDSARVLGVDVRRTRVLAVGVAVLLSATAVTVAGPIGFVGLCAPVLARLVARRVPGLGAHLLMLPFAGLAGALTVVSADVLLRLAVPAGTAISVPTGVVTTLAGAALLVLLARRLRDGGPAAAPARGGHGSVRSRTWVVAVSVIIAVALVAAFVSALLLGDRLILLGDVTNWLSGHAGRQVSFVLDQRWPRVLAALLGGAALALAGIIVQAVCRNPLAEPSLLGVTPGASVGAVAVVLLFPGVGGWPVMGVATVFALGTFFLVYRLAAGRGLSSDRIVLVGVGVSAAATALTTLIVVVVSPWNVGTALTWLAGSTYGRSLSQVVPVLLVLIVALPLTLAGTRTLDLVALDEDVPRLLGVPLNRARLLLLGLAAVLTAAAATAVGALAFVGLVAPHAARALVGSAHARAVPVAVGLGAVLVCVADTLGRTVIAPSQLAAGLVTALIGAPYFVWLLWRSRAA
ncbi:iron-hydroxamate transporter permease subunit [Paractinoplanes abujensis]|uniref:Iron complex transport system permease protein n=1 Tax=Paractinoplanes abujensis TaxID=882441 RepID=A0A7W7G0V9_9ACTN|nr:iron ABC transporter permease [Actinoplanes abujensis]MBB4691989.1 iron complex transport system permease protein [Actinoplanes abujensis]GID16593.1 iron-hydroxamate transporter permease subunit [Actinoplanes abujensis]